MPGADGVSTVAVSQRVAAFSAIAGQREGQGSVKSGSKYLPVCDQYLLSSPFDSPPRASGFGESRGGLSE